MPSRAPRPAGGPTPVTPSTTSRTSTSTASSPTPRSRHAPPGPRSRRPSSPHACTERLQARGVDTLWSHQAAAVDALRAGRNVVVATGTASGKSLCYQLPIVDSVVAGGRDTTLLVFPTKALAQDQLRTLPRVVGARPRRRDLRRRHPHRRTGVDPRARQRRAHQPRDAAHGHPPHARSVGHVPAAPALRRRRRAAHACGACSAVTSRTCSGACAGSASTTDRRPRSASPAPPSATRPSSRRASAGCRWKRSTATARRRPSDGSRCGNDRSSTCTRARVRRRTSETAMVLSRFVADGHQTLAFTRSRKGAELVATHARGALAHDGIPRRGRRIPRRLPRHRTARARSAAHERRARRRGRHQRARARHRHRWARRGRAQRLPRHAGLDAPTGRSCGPHDAAGRGGADRGRRPARPVVRAPSGGAARPPGRSGGGEPRQPVRGASPDRVRGARASPHALRRPLLR